MLTYAAIDSWHGPHTAYFFAFIMGGFLQSLGKYIRTSVRPFFLAPGTLANPEKSSQSGAKTFYDILCIINVQATLNYIVIPFLLVDVPASLEAYRRLGWYGHWMTFVPLAFFWIGGGGMLRSMLTEREAKHVTSASKELASYEANVNKRLGEGADGVHGLAPVPGDGPQENGSANGGRKQKKR